MTKAGRILSVALLGGAFGAGALPAQAEASETDSVALTVDRGSGMAAITVSKAGDGLGAPIILRPKEPTPTPGTRTLRGNPPAGMPVRSSAVTSRFGMRHHPTLGRTRMHSGVDLEAPTGSPVVAAADGVVAYANWMGSYGLLVTLRHASGFETRFAHLSRIMVSPGQQVTRGQVLGLVGSTGRSTGAHLHYEVRQNGAAVDPLGFR